MSYHEMFISDKQISYSKKEGYISAIDLKEGDRVVVVSDIHGYGDGDGTFETLGTVLRTDIFENHVNVYFNRDGRISCSDMAVNLRWNEFVKTWPDSEPTTLYCKYRDEDAEYIDLPEEIIEVRTQQKIKAIYKNVGRNEPCPCLSGKKYKKCCIA